MPRSIVLRGLTLQALGVAFVSSLIVGYNLIAELGLFSLNLPMLTLPMQPFSLTTSSLGLLLVFRTNASYTRWKEARLSWAVVSAKSFDLMRQASTWMQNEKCIAALARYTVAFSKCLQWQLTSSGREELRVELGDILQSFEIEAVIASEDMCQHVLVKMTRLIREDMVKETTHMDKSICALSTAKEQCEMIVSTPIPLAYTRHTCRFLVIWLATIPLALYGEFPLHKKWVVPVISFLNSIFLFGIEDLGVQIEEPFSILPLAHFVSQTQKKISAILSDAGISSFFGTDLNRNTLKTLTMQVAAPTTPRLAVAW
jgi:putative membrane protein